MPLHNNVVYTISNIEFICLWHGIIKENVCTSHIKIILSHMAVSDIKMDMNYKVRDVTFD